MNNLNDDKIDIKDIYNTFWRCRDFELANLWQRSIFLTTFLVLCFTAYGTILLKMFDINITDLQFNILNLIAYGLSYIGVLLSIFWIKMGKGSKAWYEKYENAIVAIEKDTEYSTQEASKIGGFSYHKLKKFSEIDKDNNVFSSKAGAYSVSKINIAIGQVTLILWLIIGVSHIITASIKIGCIQDSNIICILSVSSGIIAITIFTLYFSRKKYLRSNAI